MDLTPIARPGVAGNNVVAVGPLFTGVPGQPCIGNSSRNQFTGPGFVGTDFAAQKSFWLGSEAKIFLLRAEIYNLFDRANYYNPEQYKSRWNFAKPRLRQNKIRPRAAPNSNGFALQPETITIAPAHKSGELPRPKVALRCYLRKH